MFQGLGTKSYMPQGTETLWFINRNEIPKHKKPTNVNVVCADRPEKSNARRVRWTAGGDRINYPGNKTTKTAEMTTAKLMFNSVISTPGARFMGIDLKYFYLCSNLPEYEYVQIPIHLIPDAIMTLYALQDKVSNGYVYTEVRKGMYRLPQAGRLANEKLRTFLKPHGYVPCNVTPGLWKCLHNNLMFTLVVDDFGVRYTKRSDVEELLTILKLENKLTTDWAGTRYIGLTLDWDYDNGHVDISMPGYISRSLLRFAHQPPRRSQHAPHKWSAPVYGSRQQYATRNDTPALDVANIKRVQEVLDMLLYYAQAVDSTMLAAIGSIATQQSNAMQNTLRAITQLLDYAASHPDAIIRFKKSGMRCSMSKVTLCTFLKRKHDCASQGTTTSVMHPLTLLSPWPLMPNHHLLTAPSTFRARSYARYSPVPPNLNSEDYFITAK
jgi:hypothetical protein